VPDVRMVAFGHLGDGNIHFNFTKPEGMADETYMANREAVNAEVYGLVLELGGSFSAEHGIGMFKTDLMEQTKSPVELKLMRQLKACFDPQGIMNPGKVLKVGG